MKTDQKAKLIAIIVLLPVLGYMLWDTYESYRNNPIRKARREMAAAAAEPPPAPASVPPASLPKPAVPVNPPLAAPANPPPAPVVAAAPVAAPPAVPPAAPPAAPVPVAAPPAEGDAPTDAQLAELGLAGKKDDPALVEQDAREAKGIVGDPVAVVPVHKKGPAPVVPAGPEPVQPLPKPEHEFDLRGIYVSWNAAFAAAILDGAVVHVDDRVADSYRVAEISEAGVRLAKVGPEKGERFLRKPSPLDANGARPGAARTPRSGGGVPGGDAARTGSDGTDRSPSGGR